MKRSLPVGVPIVIRGGRAALWVITAVSLVMCLWHMHRCFALGASWHLVQTAWFGYLGFLTLWAGLASRQQIASGAVIIARSYRESGRATACEYSREYAKQRLSIRKVVGSGALLGRLGTPLDVAESDVSALAAVPDGAPERRPRTESLDAALPIGSPYVW